MINALLSSYGVICSPWCWLEAFHGQAKTKLLTTDCFSTSKLVVSVPQIGQQHKWKHENKTVSIGVWGYEILGVLTVVWAKIVFICNYTCCTRFRNQLTPPCNFLFTKNVVELTGILFINYTTRGLWIISGTTTNKNKAQLGVTMYVHNSLQLWLVGHWCKTIIGVALHPF